MKRGFSGELKCESAELKGFNIPRKCKNHACERLIPVDPGSMEEREILQDVQKTAINSAYDRLWKVRFVKLLQNSSLEKNFFEKRRELKAQGSRSVAEELAFSVETVYDFEQLLQEGKQVKQCSHSLGNPLMGISLFRHVDVALRFARYMECGSPVEVVVYKVVLGRPKMIHPRKSAADGFLDPTPNYDSHVSSVKPTNTDGIFDLLERSMVYLYEYNDQATPVSHPRQCVPIAVVSFNNFTMPYLGYKPKFHRTSNLVTQRKAVTNKCHKLSQPGKREQTPREQDFSARPGETQSEEKEIPRLKEETCNLTKTVTLKEENTNLMKETAGLKNEALCLLTKEITSVEIETFSKSSNKSCNQTEKKTVFLNSKHQQLCDKTRGEKQTQTVSSQSDRTPVKNVDLHLSRKSKDSGSVFFKRLLHKEFLRRKSELQRKLLNSTSEIELDESDRLVLETTVKFCIPNEQSDISTDSDHKMVEIQDSPSDLVKIEQFCKTSDLEPETMDISEKSPSVINDSFNTGDGERHLLNFEDQKTFMATGDLSDTCSPLYEQMYNKTEEEKCSASEYIQNLQNKDMFSLEVRDNVSVNLTQIGDAAFSDKNAEVQTIGQVVFEKVSTSPVKNRATDGCKTNESKYRPPRKESRSFSNRKCSPPRKHQLGTKDNLLQFSSKDYTLRVNGKCKSPSSNALCEKKRPRFEKRTKKLDGGLPISNIEEHCTNNQDSTDKFSSKNRLLPEKCSKLSPEEALNKLHDLLQQTGHFSIEFSTITDILTGKIITKDRGTAPETKIVKKSIDNMHGIHLSNANCVQQEIADQLVVPTKSPSNEIGEDIATNKEIHTHISDDHTKTESHVQKARLSDPRLESTKPPIIQNEDNPVYPTAIDPTLPSSAKFSSRKVHSKRSTRKRTVKKNISSIQELKNSNPKLKQSGSLSEISCPVGTAPRVNCNRPLTCPFYSLVPSTFIWKVEKIDLAEKSDSILETDLIAQEDGKPKFNGRTLLKGGVDPRTIPLQRKDSVWLELLDPRKNKSAKQSDNVKCLSGKSIDSECGSCGSIISVDSGVADMDICGTVPSCIHINPVLENPVIPTDIFDATGRITDIMNDPKQHKPKSQEQKSTSESVLEISPNGTTKYHNLTTTQVDSVTPSNLEKLGDIRCRCNTAEHKEPFDNIKAAPPLTSCLSMYDTPNKSSQHPLGKFPKCTNDFPGSIASQDMHCDLKIKTECPQTDTPSIIHTCSVYVPQPTDILPLKDGFRDVSNTERQLDNHSSKSSNINQPMGTCMSKFIEPGFTKRASQIVAQYCDIVGQNSFFKGSGNMVRNPHNCMVDWQNVPCSYANPYLAKQPVCEISTVFQALPKAGERRAENLVQSPFAYPHNLLPSDNIPSLGQGKFDARQRINEIRCAKLTSEERLPGNNYPIHPSKKSANGTVGRKRPLSDPTDKSRGKRMRSKLNKIDLEDVLERIQTAANVVQNCTRLPPVMPRYSR